MSEDGGCFVTCVTVVEWFTPQGTTLRKVSHRTATSRLTRNSDRELMVEVRGEKASSLIKLHLQDIAVFNRFMSEGKASIKFKRENCTVYFSNAPIEPLTNFLKTIYIKTSNADDGGNNGAKNPLREKLMSNRGGTEDVSPATIAEINRAKEKAVAASRATITTPSPTNVRKRKLGAENGIANSPKIPRAKKLFHNLGVEELTEEQSRILQCVKQGKNIFFTGSAGTGKSFLLKKIIDALPPNVTMATASTGVAACAIGGITLHQFAGIGLGTATIERCKQMVSKTASLWRKTKHLIIDEISMVEGDYFDKIETIARFVRNSEKPFGGIQLILCGDFFQLPPVSKKDEKVNFCFQSKAWGKCVQLNFELKTVHRQTDPKFVNILNKLRIGQVTDEISEVLKNTSKQKIESDGILATRLCSHVNEANDINESQLEKLTGVVKTYVAQDSSEDQFVTRQLDQQLTVPSKLVLKVGAQVMLLKNLSISKGLVNGARGVIVKFEDDLPVVHFRKAGNYKARMEKWSIKVASGAVVFRKQLPLKLAWAFSIHKSQGLTLDCVEMSLARVFDAGQAYVALSRAQSLQTLRVLDFSSEQVWANKEVLNFYKKFRRQIELTEIVPLGKKPKFG
ncbi:ATP-dependent DNA helicase PIF1 [Copidosoma floridanum]|uniref:ATP-dependent DNA helicase PIF1 n=1 Tax=Copidosoma floridanum TaxID=29053 RepID=UPI0006C94EC4|nr:ATP-dependent DNA helicase PIF1 [Copidosoma floridanum]